jgi:hypothetical protein
MRFSRILALLVTAALIGAPALPAFAEPATTASSPSTRTAAPTKAATRTLTPDAVRYGVREAASKTVADFQGGGGWIYIGGGSVLLVVLIVVLVVVLL